MYAYVCVIKSMVQVETLGELGVFFTLFVVGLEFSPERLRKVPLIPTSPDMSKLFIIKMINFLVIYSCCYVYVDTITRRPKKWEKSVKKSDNERVYSKGGQNICGHAKTKKSV